MRVPDDVGQPLTHHPAEQFLVRRVDHVHGAGQVGGDAGRPQQLPPGGQLTGERHVAVVGHRGAHVAQRLPGQGLHLGDLLPGPGRVDLTQPGARPAFTVIVVSE